MKKKIFMIVAIACMAFSAPTSAFADGELEQVDLQVSIWNPTQPNNGPHKAPPRPSAVQIPTVFLDDIQNESVGGTKIYQANTIKVGTNVTNTKPIGSVVFNGNKTILIGNEIEINGETTVELGTELEIHTE